MVGKELLEEIIETYSDETFLKADGFDEAIIGIDGESHRLIYSVGKCLDILMENNQMDYEDAVEHLDFNVINAYVGDKTPIWCEDIF